MLCVENCRLRQMLCVENCRLRQMLCVEFGISEIGFFLISPVSAFLTCLLSMDKFMSSR
jgi:hypothetical protein